MTTTRTTQQPALDAQWVLDDLERRAWEALERYQLLQFGEWAEMWAWMNKLSPGTPPRRNPFAVVVEVGRRHNRVGGATNQAPARREPIGGRSAK